MPAPPPADTLVPELCACLHARRVYLRLWRRVRAHAPALLAHLRGRRGWTQAELARRLGVDLATVGKIEAGRERLSEGLADRVARLLAAEGWIVGDEGEGNG